MKSEKNSLECVCHETSTQNCPVHQNSHELIEFGDIGIRVMIDHEGNPAYWLEILHGRHCGEGMQTSIPKFNAWIERFYRENF